MPHTKSVASVRVFMQQHLSTVKSAPFHFVSEYPVPESDQGDTAQRPDDAAHEEFVRLFAETNHRIYAFVTTLVPHHADADDVFQQTSVVLWRKFADFDPTTDFVAWACRVAHFEVMNFRRTSGRRAVVFDDQLVENLSKEWSQAEPQLGRRNRLLEACMDELPPKDHQIIQACYARGAKINRVAERLGGSVNTLYKTVARIRRALRECIERRLAEEEA
ncbi:MAG: sigma-70 family RNA polymerase sigma factor [Pirellulales bacterium]|nr:sigma-70 family RNA polymerase sigma factor [Pirellulales bacterium]